MVGDKLKAWRKAHGDMSTRDAAEAAGVSQPVWLSLEKGEGKRTGLEVALKIVSLLEGAVTLEELAAEERRKRRPRKKRASLPPPSRRVA